MESNQRENEDYQNRILPGVSRTFAFTIPQLPQGLRSTVTNAYLLCRIADTIEDDVGLKVDQKTKFLKEFQAVVEGHACAKELSNALSPLLSPQTLSAEHDLINNMAKVIEHTHGFNTTQQTALQQCIKKMTTGMHQFERNRNLAGLKTLNDLNDYCYYVAGVVGELLTELFCDYSPLIKQHQPAMMSLAVSFGQGLR